MLEWPCLLFSPGSTGVAQWEAFARRYLAWVIVPREWDLQHLFIILKMDAPGWVGGNKVGRPFGVQTAGNRDEALLSPQELWCEPFCWFDATAWGGGLSQKMLEWPCLLFDPRRDHRLCWVVQWEAFALGTWARLTRPVSANRDQGVGSPASSYSTSRNSRLCLLRRSILRNPRCFPRFDRRGPTRCCADTIFFGLLWIFKIFRKCVSPHSKMGPIWQLA